MSNDRIHRFHTSVSGIELPAQFTFPFHYVPHPLAVAAAGEVMSYVPPVSSGAMSCRQARCWACWW